jgi:uncharacterized membrane protein (UPF0127 family)
MPTSNGHLGFRLKVATKVTERLLGLMAKGALSDADALMLVPCNSIHSFGMPKAIDVAFIDSHGKVLKSLRNLPPHRLASCRAACATLERFSDDSLDWFEPGQSLTLATDA